MISRRDILLPKERIENETEVQRSAGPATNSTVLHLDICLLCKYTNLKDKARKLTRVRFTSQRKWEGKN